MKNSANLIFVVALSYALIASAVHAQTPPAPVQASSAAQVPTASTADVQPLLDQVAAAYRNLTAFSTTLDFLRNNRGTETRIITKLTLKRPAMLVAEIKAGDVLGRMVADGKTVYTDSTLDKTKYIKQSAENLDDVLDVLIGNGGAGVRLLPLLLTSKNAEAQIIAPMAQSVKRLLDQKVGKDDCDVIEALVGDGQRTSRLRIAFSKQDHLLRQITLTANIQYAKPSVIETYVDTNLQPALTPDTFKYTPAPGATAVPPPADYDPRLKVGATPFEVTGKDLSGKPVSLDQYKGKVLLLDFWATWCAPCVGEVPNVVTAYARYHAKDFEVLGVSLDRENTLPTLTQFIQDHKMPWRQIYDARGVNADTYGLQAIPFTLLIGRDGKIAAIGARGPALVPAIETALAKPYSPINNTGRAKRRKHHSPTHQATSAQTPGTKAPGAKPKSTNVPGAKTPGTKAPGAKAIGAKASIAKTKSAKTKSAKTKSAKTKDAKATSTKAPSAKTPDVKAPSAKTPNN